MAQRDYYTMHRCGIGIRRDAAALQLGLARTILPGMRAPPALHIVNAYPLGLQTNQSSTQAKRRAKLRRGVG